MTKLQPHCSQSKPCLRINQSWTPEQAMAVFELITDLRDLIWSHYDLALQAQYQRDQLKHQGWDDEPEQKDPEVPF